MLKNEKILGGPGCGKSYNLMQKYSELISAGYTPEDITLITFRKTSAQDLIEAVTKNLGVKEKDIQKHVGTIHSICWRLGGRQTQISTEEKAQFISINNYTPYLKVKSASSDEETAYSGNLFDMYTWFRNTQTPIEKYYYYPGSKEVLLPSEKIPEFIRRYDEFKKLVERIDFSDMLQFCLDNKIMLDTPVLMIDEFQDLTSQMYQLFKMWAEHCEIVVIAGDPFQSIYGFWGGSPKYFNEWTADEVILQETHRLPQQIQDFARKILRSERMIAPDLKAKQGCTDPIIFKTYSDILPMHKSELHLVRCNYQAGAVALALAESGKLFTGLNGWTAEEITLANAVIAVRCGYILNRPALQAIIEAYPLKLSGLKNKTEIAAYTVKVNGSDDNKYMSALKPQILTSLKSADPTALMSRDSKIFTAKLHSILNRKNFIMSWETTARKVLTIHGSKGLEAEAVFLHTSITPRIYKSLVIPGEDSAAEARVWYVGATRAKEKLYIVKDAGRNYSLAVGSC